MSYEASKAAMRRNFDRRFATTYFVGDGIDIGCGPDPISNYAEFYPLMRRLMPFDQEHGDGMLLECLADETFDFVHSSHSLEHMTDPQIAMNNWLRVLKKGGHLVIMLPDEDMFEQGNWPSKYAGADHVTSWTIHKHESWAPKSINVTEFFTTFIGVEILKIEKLDSTYRYNAIEGDQTQTPIGECAIEIVLRKKTDEELVRKGRLPPQQMMTWKIGN